MIFARSYSLFCELSPIKDQSVGEMLLHVVKKKRSKYSCQRKELFLVLLVSFNETFTVNYKLHSCRKAVAVEGFECLHYKFTAS